MTQRSLTLIICAVLLVAAGAFWIQTGNLEYPSSVFPKAVIGLFALIILLTAGQAAFAKDQDGKVSLGSRRGHMAFLFTIAYGVMIPVLGTFTATFGYMIALLILQENKKKLRLASWARAIAAAFVVTGVIYVIFSLGLKVMMPVGVFI